MKKQKFSLALVNKLLELFTNMTLTKASDILDLVSNLLASGFTYLENTLV